MIRGVGERGACRRAWPAVTAVFILAAGLVGHQPAALARSEVPPAAPLPAMAGPAWGHELAGREPDPAVRFGRLANGLRYAIQRNDTPKDSVAMRLYIGAGSMHEREDEQGLAHFLEHMAFRGSRNLADGELVRMTERLGLRLGPDSNAYTAHDRTVYLFNFPRSDAESINTGFTLFREIAEHLTIDPAKVEIEKGVILSEERTRDVVGYRAQKAELGNLFAGSRWATRWPIGRVETIQAATPERLRRYYEANYRPDNAAIVVVGAVDVDAIERQIRDRFGNWKANGEPERIDFGRPVPAQPAVEFVADGLPERVTMTWVQPPDLRVSTVAVDRERVHARLAVSVLNQRLSDRSMQPGSPMLAAGAAVQFSVNRLAGLAQLGVVAPTGQWRPAMDAAVEELRRLLQDGVNDADLKRLIPAERSGWQSAVAEAATRQTADLADELVASVYDGEVHTSPAQDLAFIEPILDRVTAEELTAAARRVFSGQGPVVFRAASGEPAGADVLAGQLARAWTRPLAAAQAPAAVVWPYTDFGTPSAVVERITDADLGATLVRFANGTRLMVKPTAQEKDRIQVQVRLGAGRSGIGREHVHAVWALDTFPIGGTGRLSQAQIVQWLQASGLQIGVSLQPNLLAFALNGGTRPADLAAQLQLMAAHARDPGFRPEMGEKLMAAAPMVSNNIEAVHGAVYRRAFSQVVGGGDPRLADLPTAADVTATRPEDLPAVLRGALSMAADVVIVGDTEVDAAIRAVQATFGAGPERPRAAPGSFQVQWPAPGTVHTATHRGRADQAVLGQVWPLPDGRAAPVLRSVAPVAAAIIRARLVDSVREQLGITYSPDARAWLSMTVTGQGYFHAQIETPPERFETFRGMLRKHLLDLAAQPVGADELQRARQPMLESRRKAPEQNGFWVTWLANILTDPSMKAALLGEITAMEAVTAEQVQAFIREHLADRAPIEIVVRAP